MKRLVIFSFDTFGDLTLRQSFFKELLDLGYEITMVVKEPFAVILPFLDARLTWLTTSINPYQVKLEDEAAVKQLQAKISALKPDALISITYFYTELEEWLMLLFPKLPRYGFDNPYLGGLRHRIPHLFYRRLKGGYGVFNHLVVGCCREDHEFKKTQRMFHAITDRTLTNLPQIKLPATLLTQNESLLKDLGLQQGQYVIAALGGNTNNPIKLLPLNTCAEVIAYITKKYGYPVLMTGVASEQAHLENIASRCKVLGVNPSIWIGTADSFKSLLALIQNSRFYYGNDTGAMHFAAAMNIPILAHFGGGNWLRFLPLAEKSYVLTQKLACFNCDWSCWAKTPLCINLVAPEKFFYAVDWILDKSTTGNILDEGVSIAPVLNDLIKVQALKHQYAQRPSLMQQCSKGGLRLLTLPLKLPRYTARTLRNTLYPRKPHITTYDNP